MRGLILAIASVAIISPMTGFATGNFNAGELCQTIPDEQNQCRLAGKWKNQLQSVMEITCRNGMVVGKYNTAVGRAQDFYKLAGLYTMAGVNVSDTVLSWTVSWNNDVFGNSNSSTAWTGIHYPEEGIIHTQWILIRHQTRSNLWQASMIGHDEFQRVC